MIRLLLLKILVISSGCAHSVTSKDKIIRNMAIGLVSGAVVGAASAPDGEKREAHALLWGSVMAATSGAYSVQKYDTSKELEKLRLKVKQADLMFSNDEDVRRSNLNTKEVPVSTVNISEGLPYDKMPPSIRNNIKPTQIKVKKVDEWRLGSSPNSHLHCETEVEFEASKIVK